MLANGGVCQISKGHLVASRYGKTFTERMEATYTFTNIVPQFESFNNKEWKDCEHYLIDEWGPQICASSEHAEVNNGNCTEWRAIWSEIKRVITKSHDRVAGVRFVITSLISDQNCPPLIYHFIIFILKS